MILRPGLVATIVIYCGGGGGGDLPSGPTLATGPTVPYQLEGKEHINHCSLGEGQFSFESNLNG